MAFLIATLALACLSSTAMGVITPPARSVLNQFTNQKTITAETGEGNPYGLAAITFNKGKLVAGNFLATNWNDANGNPGQGHTIVQVTQAGVSTPFATINPNSPLITANCGNTGVGLTMALAILSRGFVVVGSTPIAVGGTVAGPGCLILLDSMGTVLDAHAANEQTNLGTMTGGGPWGMAVSEFNNGNQAYLFVSYVLGNNPASTNILTGAAGGMVVRYGVQVPANAAAIPQFWGPAPVVVASGFPTQPGNIGGGAVGPAGLLVGKLVNGMSYGGALNKNQLFIANTLNSSITVVKQSTVCGRKGQGACSSATVAWGGLLNGPVGLGLSPLGTIVTANGGIGTLVEVAPTPNTNTQLAVQLVDNVNTDGATVAGAGALFNVLFHPAYPKTIFFNDDAQNSFNTLT